MLATQIADQKIQVLLIEDSRTEAMVVQAALAREDGGRLAIRTAASLAQGVDALSAAHVDVVLLDLGLPDADGPESILRLNREFPHVSVVILSGRTDEVAMLRALEYGAQEFLLKGQCTGAMIRHAIFSALFRKSLRKGKAQ